MRDLKKVPKKQLEKFSTVFTQLGLVLALFVAYAVLEHQTLEKIPIADIYESENPPYVMDFITPKVYRKEVVKPKENPQPKKVKTNLTKIKKVDNELEKYIESVIDKPKDVEPQTFDPNTYNEVPEETKIDDSEVPFLIIEEVPIYKGCEGLPNEATKACFIKKITKHVQRNFNSNLAQDLGIRSGKHKMYAMFVIDAKGDVTQVKIRAPHKRLEKETQRIVNKIPQFTPGKQRGKPVKVKYTLPITFYVE